MVRHVGFDEDADGIIPGGNFLVSGDAGNVLVITFLLLGDQIVLVRLFVVTLVSRRGRRSFR
jgi:hypothetical protein